MKIVILDGYTTNPGDLSWDFLNEFGTYTVYDRTPKEKIVERAQGCDIIITNKTPIDARTIAALPELKFITLLSTGFNVVDVKVTLFDGSYHEVDSSEMAFKIAASMAFKDAMKKAGPVLMEPIMKTSVIVPDEYMGDVIGDINSRRGTIQGTETRTGAVQINAFIPLSNMFGYATALRSKTQGRGQYVMEPSHYTEVPKSIAEKIVSEK